MIFLPSASTTKGRKKSAVEKKEIVVAHMANKRQNPAKKKKYICKQKWFISSTLLPLLFHIFRAMYGSYFKLESYQTYFAMPWYSST